jgi:uncharacterized membrane protein YbhN (UPF0104 family)
MRKAAPPNVDPAHGRDTPYPVDHDPAEVRGWNWRGGPLRPLLVAFLALVLVGMVLWGIEKEAAEIDFQLLVTTLRATPAASVAAALAATALSYLALIGYDVSALHYARAYAPLRTILLASFSGFAIGNAVGLGAFSGGAVRYRLYTAAGLSPGQIARVVLFLSIAFGVGLGTIAALSMILQASEVSRLLGVSPQPMRAIAAIILTIASGFLIFCALRRTPWRRGAIDIDAPGATLVLIQVLLTAIDVLAAAATLWVLLPSVGISFFAFSAIYCVALALGVLSHIRAQGSIAGDAADRRPRPHLLNHTNPCGRAARVQTCHAHSRERRRLVARGAGIRRGQRCAGARQKNSTARPGPRSRKQKDLRSMSVVRGRADSLRMRRHFSV